jgi:hypothetical protein
VGASLTILCQTVFRGQPATGCPVPPHARCAVFMRGGAARPKIYTTYTPSIVAKPAYVNRFDCLYRIHARFALARVAARQGYSWRHHGRVSSHMSKPTCTITRVRDLGLPSMSAPPCQNIAQSGLFETSLWTSRGTPPRSPADLGELRSAGRTGRPSLPGFMVYQLLRVQ